MREYQLVWIDDSTEDMRLVMEYVFPMVWDNNCSCKTILFGNAYCGQEREHGPGEKDRELFEQELRSFFTVYCQDIDEQEWKDQGETFKDKSDLLLDPPVSLVSMHHDSTNGSSPIAKLAEAWIDLDKQEEGVDILPKDGDDWSGYMDRPNLSVEDLMGEMKIAPGAVVALDICLLFADADRIKSGKPSISMALYNSLRKDHPCFLYSGMSIAKSVLSAWAETFKKCYGNSDVKIYSKSGLTTPEEDTVAKRALIKLIHTRGAKEHDDNKDPGTEKTMAEGISG